MPTIDYNLSDLNTGSGCGNKPGILSAYWIDYNEIDWAATVADTALFDAANQCFSGFSMIGGATWNTLGFKKNGSEYTSEYTSDTTVYDHILTFFFEGKDKVFRNNICGAIGKCDIVVKIYDRNCVCRIFGIDLTNGVVTKADERFKILSHTDTSGQFGGDLGSDTITIGGQTECPAPYGSIEEADFIATYL